MIEQSYATSAEAYKAIHTGLSAAVEVALEDCDYHDAIKWADLMHDLECNRLAMVETVTMDGTLMERAVS